MRRVGKDDQRSTLVGVRWALSVLVLSGVVGLAPQPTSAGGAGNYLALKGGIYSPSETFTLANVDVETTFDSDTRTGFSGELAYGHYFLPTVALEFGVGFFKGMGTVESANITVPSHEVDFNVVPVLATAKAFIPVGAVNPYGELGIGAYFTDVDVSDNLNSFDGSTTFGIHTGVGMNVTISPSMFMGVEGRYVWANPSFGGETIKLNDTEYTLNEFSLNGFTTTLALGYSF